MNNSALETRGEPEATGFLIAAMAPPDLADIHSGKIAVALITTAVGSIRRVEPDLDLIQGRSHFLSMTTLMKNQCSEKGKTLFLVQEPAVAIAIHLVINRSLAQVVVVAVVARFLLLIVMEKSFPITTRPSV